MADWQFANNASTNLSAALTSGATTINVDSASGFPASAQFAIIIDSEILLVTGVSGTTWTVARAQEGTSAAAHADNSTVTHILTAAPLNTFRQDEPGGMTRLTRGTAQSVANSTTETLNATTETVSDQGDDFTFASGVFTIITPGWYHMSAGVSWATNGTGYREIGLTSDTQMSLAKIQVAALSGTQTDQSVSTLIHLSAGEEVQAEVLQTSGGALDARAVPRTYVALALIRRDA